MHEALCNRDYIATRRAGAWAGSVGRLEAGGVLTEVIILAGSDWFINGGGCVMAHWTSRRAEPESGAHAECGGRSCPTLDSLRLYRSQCQPHFLYSRVQCFPFTPIHT